MAQKNSKKYWEKRRELEDKARLKMEQDMLKSLTTNLPDVLKKIQAELLSQADLHGMTQAELLEDYSLRDQKKYKKYIDKNYKELMKSDEKYQEFIDEYFPPYDYAKVNRLLQMRSDIFNIMASEMIKTDPNKKFNDGLEEIINKTYNSNSNALMYLLGPGKFNPLPKKELENMLNYPWSGKTFSNRLWGNISRLEQNLSNAIVNSVASGQGVEEALKTMKLNSEINDMFKFEGDKFKRAIDNLVRTEYAHFAVEGLRKSMSDAGIKDTQSWSAEDERVCSICGGRHGKVIEDDWHPPYHGRCRCTEIPKMPELGEDIDKLYDEMFGDLLDEFAKDKFGIKLNKPKRDIIKMSDEDRLKFLKNEMNKIENEDWGGLSEDEVSDLYDKYEAEYFKLEDKLSSNSAKDRIIQNTDKFFNDQGSYLNWKNQLTSEDKISIRKYTGAYYETYNKYLRQIDDVLKKQGSFKYQTNKSITALKNDIDSLVKSLEGYVPEYDFNVYRGMTGLNDLLKVGETQVIDKGFMSSSVYKNTGKSFAGKEDSTLYKINIKKGSSVGNYVSEFSEFKNEKEFLIKPGTKFKVVDIKTVKENGYTKQIVELETI